LRGRAILANQSHGHRLHRAEVQFTGVCVRWCPHTQVGLGGGGWVPMARSVVRAVPRLVPPVDRAIAAALCSLLIATVGIAAPTASAAGRAASSPAIAPPRAPTVTFELDLIHHHKVAPNLVHDGFNGTWQTYFPVLLKPKHTVQFWNTSQSILELAPKVSYGHSTGIALFEEAAAPQVTVRVIGSLSPTYSRTSPRRWWPFTDGRDTIREPPDLMTTSVSSADR
jgi:hypothetical protein